MPSSVQTTARASAVGQPQPASKSFRTSSSNGPRTVAFLLLLGVLVSLRVFCLLLPTRSAVTILRERPTTDVVVPPSPVPYTTGKKLITLVTSLAVPEIEAAALGNTFPSMSVSYVTIEPMRLESFSIKALKVALATPAPENVTVNVVDLKLTIPNTDFTFKYGIFTCPGVFRLKLDATQFSFDVRTAIVNETLSVTVGPDTTNITWGALSIEHDLDNFLCRIGQSIVQVFMGQMDELIESNIKEQLPVMLPKNLEEQANKALKDSGVRFSSPLVMTPDRATGQVELILRNSSDNASSARTKETRVHAEEAPVLPYKDFAAILYASSLANFFTHAQRANQLNTSVLLPDNITSEDIREVFPNAYDLCPDCAVGIGFAAVVPPNVSFQREGAVIRLALTELVTGLMLFPRTAAQHVDLVRRMAALQDSVARGQSITTAPVSQTFPVFAATGLCDIVHVAHVKCLADAALTQWAVPVVAFAVNATLAVSNLTAVGARSSSIQYKIHPVDDLAFTLVASNMGPVDAEKLTRDVAMVLNTFIIPLANTESPAPVPGPVKEIELDVDDGSLIVGFNISFF